LKHVFRGDAEKVIVGDDYEGIYGVFELLQAEVSVFLATPPLKRKRQRHDPCGKQALFPTKARNHRHSACTRTPTQSRCEKNHLDVGSEQPSQFVQAFFGGFLA